MEGSDYSVEVAARLYAEKLGALTRFAVVTLDGGVFGTLEGVGFVANLALLNDEEVEAVSSLVALIADDPIGFGAAVGKEVYNSFKADIENGDYASALGRLAGTGLSVWAGGGAGKMTAGQIDNLARASAKYIVMIRGSKKVGIRWDRGIPEQGLKWENYLDELGGGGPSTTARTSRF